MSYLTVSVFVKLHVFGTRHCSVVVHLQISSIPDDTHGSMTMMIQTYVTQDDNTVPFFQIVVLKTMTAWMGIAPPQLSRSPKFPGSRRSPLPRAGPAPPVAS